MAGCSEEDDNAKQQKESGKSPRKPRRPANRFGDMSEEDVLKLSLPEHLGYNLDILFVSRKHLFNWFYKF